MDLGGKRVLVCGAGGVSGRAAVALLHRLGASVVLSDQKKGGTEFAALGTDRLTDLRPREDAAILDEFPPDFLVISPGLPPSVPVLVEAHRRGLCLRGELDFAFEVLHETWKKRPYTIAITGTDGKSTTTALTAHLIRDAFGLRVEACGNIGLPVSSFALDVDSRDVLVVECSSFQLETVEAFSPDAAAVMNVAADHLDRYADMDEYLGAKLHILDQMKETAVFLAPPDIMAKAAVSVRSRRGVPPRMEILADPFPGGRIEMLGQDLAATDDFPLPGRHNMWNLAFALKFLEALAVQKNLPVDPVRVQGALRGFRGLPHRLERVVEKNGILYINDSKATTIQAVSVALASFPGRPVFVLCGGRYKGGDFAEWRGDGRAFYPYGESAGRIRDAVGSADTFANLEGAFRSAQTEAAKIAGAGGMPVILLSPGCSSYDLYSSYAERGEHFRRLANGAV